jgi:hypothetical protein
MLLAPSYVGGMSDGMLDTFRDGLRTIAGT